MKLALFFSRTHAPVTLARLAGAMVVGDALRRGHVSRSASVASVSSRADAFVLDTLLGTLVRVGLEVVARREGYDGSAALFDGLPL